MCPSGLNATLSHGVGVARAAGVAASRFHNRMVVSALPEARVCPSGLNATLLHGVGVAGQGLAQRARVRRVGEVPQPHGGIAAAGGQGVPVGAERHTEHAERCGRSGAGPAGPGGPDR